MYRPAVWRSVGALIASRHGAFDGLPALADDLPLREQAPELVLQTLTALLP